MRRVFLFWSLILFILILGAAAIIYGTLLLKKEEERGERIKKALTQPKITGRPGLPAMPSESEIEEALDRIETPLPALPSDLESPEAGEVIELPEAWEGGAAPPLTPRLPELPVSPEVPRNINVEPLKIPELPSVPETLPPSSLGQ